MGRKKIFRGHVKEKRYRVAEYNFKSVDAELDKVASGILDYVVDLGDLYHTELPLDKKHLLVNIIKAINAYHQLNILPTIKRIRDERTKDLKIFAGAFIWHHPISDPYIRNQFFLASKECFEMEIEGLQGKVKNFITEYEGLIKSVKARI